MKKLIMAVCAISTMSLCAATEKLTEAAQVYDVKITVKTTAAKSGKLSPAKNPFVDEAETVVYRKQQSQSWVGLIWGCNCEAILGQWKIVNDESDVVAGCAIWNSKSPYNIMLLDNMQWRMLHAIDANGTACEGSWVIGDSSDTSKAFLAASGFGSLMLSTEKEDGNLTIADCMSVVKSINGNVAGWMPAPSKTIASTKKEECTFCHTTVTGEDETTEASTAWNFCDCGEFGEDEVTAVTGTWSIKYNKTLSKKLFTKTSILDVYTKFPSNVKAAVEKKLADPDAEYPFDED